MVPVPSHPLFLHIFRSFFVFSISLRSVLFTACLFMLCLAEDFSVKKKWWETTVFRNQAKEDKKVDNTFINDSTRNAFHRKFMEKYIK